jgi:hypothetical protein
MNPEVIHFLNFPCPSENRKYINGHNTPPNDPLVKRVVINPQFKIRFILNNFDIIILFTQNIFSQVIYFLQISNLLP